MGWMSQTTLGHPKSLHQFPPENIDPEVWGIAVRNLHTANSFYCECAFVSSALGFESRGAELGDSVNRIRESFPWMPLCDAAVLN